MYMTMKKTTMVVINPSMLGSWDWRLSTEIKGCPFRAVCMRAIMAPQLFPSWCSHVGVAAKVSHTTVWATPASMKRLMPLPNPQPFWSISSSSMRMSPASINCRNTRTELWAGRAP